MSDGHPAAQQREVGCAKAAVLLRARRYAHTEIVDEPTVEVEAVNGLGGVDRKLSGIDDPIDHLPAGLIHECVDALVSERQPIRRHRVSVTLRQLPRHLQQLVPREWLLGVEIGHAGGFEESPIIHVNADRYVRGQAVDLAVPRASLHPHVEMLVELDPVTFGKLRQVHHDATIVPRRGFAREHTDHVRRPSARGLGLQLGPVVTPRQPFELELDAGVLRLERGRDLLEVPDLPIAAPEREPQRHRPPRVAHRHGKGPQRDDRAGHMKCSRPVALSLEATRLGVQDVPRRTDSSNPSALRCLGLRHIWEGGRL